MAATIPTIKVLILGDADSGPPHGSHVLWVSLLLLAVAASALGVLGHRTLTRPFNARVYKVIATVFAALSVALLAESAWEGVISLTLSIVILGAVFADRKEPRGP